MKHFLTLLFLLGTLFFPSVHAQDSRPDLPDSPPAADGAYILGFNDVVLMRVYQEEDMTTEIRIEKDGNVSLPLLGPVTVGGKTLEQATAHITSLLKKDYLVNPRVTLTVVAYAKRKFTILGQVQRPGTYELPNEQSVNLLQAIALAGGYTRIGAPWKITLQRVVDGEQRIFKLNAEAMSKDPSSTPFPIEPGDTITVGEKLI